MAIGLRTINADSKKKKKKNPKKLSKKYPILVAMLFPGNNCESLDVKATVGLFGLTC
jgi:hypothetical protein